MREYSQNIALFIPFAYDDQLHLVFELIKNFTPLELEPIVQIYKEKNTDLWRFRPGNFIDIVKRYHLVDALGIIKEFIQEKRFDLYSRKEALTLSESLSPDKEFLRLIFVSYIESKLPEEIDLAHMANSLLIKSYGDKSAIHWRIKNIKERVMPLKKIRSSG